VEVEAEKEKGEEENKKKQEEILEVEGLVVGEDVEK
jgi:hypothetical protein